MAKKSEEIKKAKDTEVKVVKERVVEKRGHGLIIFFLLIIIAILSVYICYEKGLLEVKPKEKSVSKTKVVEKQKEKDVEEEQIEVLEVVSNDVTHLFNTLTTGVGEYCGIWNYFQEEKVTTSDIPNELATSIALNALYENGIAIDRKGTTFTKKQLNSQIKEIFGQDYEYENEDIDICPTYTYDEENETYTTNEGKCKNTCTIPNKAKIVKAYKKGNDIEIYARVLFAEKNESFPAIYYKDFNKTSPLETEKSKVIDYNIDDETYAKGSLYKLTFTNENGNYIFVSSEFVPN